VKTTDPTVDNDGDPLVAGALYYNSTDGVMKVYDGGTWIAASAASQAIMVEYEYTATAGQTTFTGADDNALTLSYTAGSIIVTLNGVVLDASDYTASNGNSVVLAVGASAGDELNVRAFSTFDIANHYTQAQVDAFAVKLTGAQTVAGAKTFSDQPVMSAGISLGSNGQIVFPATQNASANANTLDDYEEGGFTPTVTAETPPSGISYFAQVGRYVKIGRMVQVEISININSRGTGGSGVASVSGLPFTSAAVANNFPNFGIAMAPVTSPVGGQITGQVNQGTASVQLVFETNTTNQLTAMSYPTIASSSNIRMSFSYQTT
jgi:hypothetical protein